MGGRTTIEGRDGPVTEWVVDEVCSRMEGGVIQACVGYSEGRESCVFISAYGPGSEEEIDELWNELSECVGSFGRNESVVVLGDLNAEWEMK